MWRLVGLLAFFLNHSVLSGLRLLFLYLFSSSIMLIIFYTLFCVIILVIWAIYKPCQWDIKGNSPIPPLSHSRPHLQPYLPTSRCLVTTSSKWRTLLRRLLLSHCHRLHSRPRNISWPEVRVRTYRFVYLAILVLAMICVLLTPSVEYCGGKSLVPSCFPASLDVGRHFCGSLRFRKRALKRL